MKFIIASLAAIAFAADIKDAALQNKQLDANKSLQAEKRAVGAKPLEKLEEQKMDKRADLRAVKKEEAKKADLTTAEVKESAESKIAEKKLGAAREKLEERKAAIKTEAKKLVQ